MNWISLVVNGNQFMDKSNTKYKKFRTGLTFKDVRKMLWSYSDNPKDWRHVTRHTVLGKFREIKLEMFHRYKSCSTIEDITTK